MTTLISLCAIVFASVLIPLLPWFHCTYKTLLRALIAIGFFGIALMAICRWLMPSVYAPVERGYQWDHGTILVQLSLRLSFFYSLIALFMALILLWVEFRFYRLAPSPIDRSHLRTDAILVAAYLAGYAAYVWLF
jgi:hypothetical protein